MHLFLSLSLLLFIFIAAFHNYSSIWSPYSPSPIIIVSGGWALAPLTQTHTRFSVSFLHIWRRCVGVRDLLWETLLQHWCDLHVSKVPPTSFCLAGAEGCCSRCLEVDSGQYSIRAMSLSSDLCRQACSSLIKDCNILSALVLFKTVFCILLWAVYFHSIQSNIVQYVRKWVYTA